MPPPRSPPPRGRIRTLPDLIRAHARVQPEKLAIADGDAQVTYEELDRAMDRIAAALQRDGTAQRQAVASVAYPCVAQALEQLGARPDRSPPLSAERHPGADRRHDRGQRRRHRLPRRRQRRRAAGRRSRRAW
ncbi:hypothetical protein AB5I41_02300 [Sphingomonas sp. MMS24-JH45]